MRIVILNDRIPPESAGGAGRVVWTLAGGLRAAGHDVHVIAATPDKPFAETRDGIPTYHIHSRYPERFRAYYSLYNPQTARAVQTLYQRIQPDVVNGHNVHSDTAYYSFVIAHKLGLPTVFNSHDVMPFAYNRLRHFVRPDRCGVEAPEAYRLPRFYNLREMRFRYNPLRNLIIRYILRHYVDVRVSVSEAHCQTLHANGLPPFQVVHNGIDPAQSNVSESLIEQMRARLGVRGRKVILFGGRMTPDKGGQQVLAAFKQVVAQIPEALLLILTAGGLDGQGLDAPEYAHLRENHVRAGGWLSGDELAAAFQVADVVTVPSIIMDSFPTMNLEAMAAGVPVIATCYGGSAEAVVDGETGYIVNPFDTAQFADRLIRLLNDEALRQQMGAHAKQRVIDHFSLLTQVSAMIQVYEAAHYIRYNERRRKDAT